MAKKECVVCGNTIGALTGKIKCLDGFVCRNCYKDMGFSPYDGKMLVEFQKRHLNELQALSSVDNGAMSTREKIETLIVEDPGINLKEKEVCFFYAEAFVGKQHTRTTSYSSAGLHTNLHVMKGVNLRIGNAKYTPNQ